MNSCVFLAARKEKKRLISHLLRLRLSLRSGKVILVVFKFWKTWVGWGWWWGGKEKKPLYVLILGNVLSVCYFFIYLWKIKFSSTSAFFPQHFWRIETRSDKNLSYSPFLPPLPFIKGLVMDWPFLCSSGLKGNMHIIQHHIQII